MTQLAGEPTTTAPIAVRPTTKGWRVYLDRFLPAISIVVFLVLWQVLAAPLNPLLFPTPTDVVSAFFELLVSGELVEAFMVSLKDLAWGFGLAVIVGISVGTLMGRSRTFERVMQPYVSFFMATPTIALIPLFIIWFGLGDLARVVVVFKLAVWSILINTCAGVKSTDRVLRQVSHAFRLNRRQYLRWVALPSALPFIFSGLKIGLGKAIIGMIVAQMTMQLTGLGGLIMSYGNAFKTAHLLAGVVTSSIFGVVVVGLMNLSQNRMFPWIKGQAGIDQT